MKKKEKTSLSHMSGDDMKKELTALVKKLEAFGLDRFAKQHHNTRESREMRKKIAVMQTFLHQKELTA